ncbi:septum formation family protein [Cellulomonas sp. KRMCY2]|uniref:septum formation family protein n=1 Tax=Cellulomonas sp. KRMCY2 TaxID=1304865 RepID=UPI00045E65A8|nr:septum formation family protein [Cellulomonas sp. KRMCY2]
MRALPRRAAALLIATVMVGGLTACGPGDAVRDEESGEIVEGSDSDVFSLRIGDCLNTAEAETEVQSVQTIPCAEAHDSEVYATTDLADGEFPGQDEVFAQADDFCYAEFETFIGVSYDDSEIYLQSMAPTQESWDNMDDRQILCLAVDTTTKGGVTGTMANAGR